MEHQNYKGQKILAVDDMKEYLEVLAALLEKLFPGISVFTALSGKEGLELARKEKPDVILLDVVMPEMDGFEVCKLLKARDDTKYIPVIMVTGIKINDNGRIDAIGSGADTFLTKPFREAELLTQVRAMLRIKAAEDLLQEKMNTLRSLVGSSSSALRDERENKKKTENIIRMYADIIDNMRLGLIVYHLEDIDDDRTLRLIHVNPACLEILGLVETDLVGKTLDENFPGLREKGIPQRYAEVIRTGEHIRFQEFYYKDERLPKAGYRVHAFPLSDYCVGVLFEGTGERKESGTGENRY